MANKDIIQSYILTVARYDANIHVKRILTHIVNANQDYLQGEKVGGGVVVNIEEDLFKEREYTIDIKNILQGEEDKNYKRVIEAFYYLQEKFIRFDNEDDNHISVPFITSLLIKKRSGIAKFRMSQLVYKAFADFTKGFRKLEFELTLSFTSVYSIRMYELMSGQKSPLTYSIDYLKEMFELQDKYKKNVNDFIKRVIEPAKKELDEKSPYTFDYKMNKTGRKFTSITFFPVYQPEHRNPELEQKDLQKKVSPAWDLSRPVLQYLKHQFEFTSTEIKTHVELFKNAQSGIDDFVLFMSKVKARANRAKNPKGYLINAIRKELKQT